jgi:formate hydrogenlyase subunit 3/multisubunit Na+/H+ antiporter MnhD subunit
MSLPINAPVLLLMFSPLIASLVCLVGKLVSPRYSVLPAFMLWAVGSIAALIVSAPTVLNGGSLLYTFGGWAEPYGIVLEVNGITWLATLIDVLIGSAAWLQSRRYRRFGPLFYFFFFMTFFSLQGVLYTRDLFNLFVWFEVLSLSSFMLITYDQNRSTYIAAVRYLLISTVSVVFFLLGVWIIYTVTGSLSLPTIASALTKISSGHGSGIEFIKPAVALMSAGILTRAAVVPFHAWLPEAHAAAPYPVSALLSGFVIKAPMLALWRIYDYISFPQSRELLIWIGCICGFVGVLAAMVQKDAKKLLGFHSVSQMGYIVAAFAVGGTAGKAASLFYIIGHALFKSLLFLTVGRVTERIANRNVYEVRGMGRFFPVSAVLFAVAAFSISGVPLFAGFTAKLLVSKVLQYHSAYWMLFAAGIGTAASFFKLGCIFIGAHPRGDNGRLEWLPSDISSSRVSAVFADIGTAALAGGCLVMGIVPNHIHALFVRLIEGKTINKTISALSTTDMNSVVHWYTLPALLKTAGMVAGGFIISLILLSGPGKTGAHLIRARMFGINGSLRLLTGGFILFIFFYVLWH